MLHVPHHDYVTYMATVVRRYLERLATFGPIALAQATKHPPLGPLSDDDLCEMAYHGPMSRVLTRVIDDEAAAQFAQDLMTPRYGGAFVLNDLRCLEGLEFLPGVYAAPSITLFEEVDDRLFLRAIALGGMVFRAGDGGAFELAKYFVAQGNAYALVMSTHARLHFPMDTINAVTRKWLPPDHVLRKLLEPHCFMALCLNYGVLYHPMSVVHNNQAYPHTPFPGKSSAQLKLIMRGYHGHRGLAAWPAYRYPLGRCTVLGPYGRFLAAYEDVIHRHVGRILAGVDPMDPHVLHWSQEIAARIPGFPGALQLAKPGMLASAASAFIATVSIHHSTDHENYGQSDPDKTPLRLRVPPPTPRDARPIRWSALRHRSDVFRQLVAHEMFFKLHTLRPLLGVDYGFEEAELRMHQARFVAELRACRPQTRRYADLEAMGTSIQS